MLLKSNLAFESTPFLIFKLIAAFYIKPLTNPIRDKNYPSFWVFAYISSVVSFSFSSESSDDGGSGAEVDPDSTID